MKFLLLIDFKSYSKTSNLFAKNNMDNSKFSSNKLTNIRIVRYNFKSIVYLKMDECIQKLLIRMLNCIKEKTSS